MNHPFYPGQRVVCLDDRFPDAVFECYDDVPRRGGVYTVAEILFGRNYCTGIVGPCIRLQEVPPLDPHKGAFCASRFRPLHPKETAKTHHETPYTQGQAFNPNNMANQLPTTSSTAACSCGSRTRDLFCPTRKTITRPALHHLHELPHLCSQHHHD